MVEGTIPERFEAQVARWPDRPAISFGESTVSYRKLDLLSNRLANRLVAAMAESPQAVALLLPQGVDLIVAILGVLKGGKYYVGLDDTSAPESVSSTISDARARVLLTSSSLRSLAESVVPDGTAVYTVDEVTEHGGEELPPSVPIKPDHLAYLFYTSGTTGRPKAVMDNHRNVLHNVMRYTNTLRIAASDRMTLLQSANFSGSVSSLFGALLNGACACPIDVRRTTPYQLARWLTRERVTIYHSVPAIFRSIVEHCESIPDVRLVRLEGDAASRADIRLFARRARADAVLVNGLGTTETGLVRQYFVSPSDTIEGTVVPVGYPVRDMEVCVLDEHGRPVPQGDVGEIAVRSEYLALGYRGNPELTAARFLSDPDQPSIRTYLTGDLGRMRSDGCLEHLGRAGRQLRIRGRTIELADVEQALLDLESIKEAAVVASESDPESQSLIAYFVAEAGYDPLVRHIREGLERRLPSFMIPSYFLAVEALPWTSHGKLDRGQLPTTGLRSRALDAGFEHPRNTLEVLIAGIWEQILGVKPVGVRDDFLELGGDSLAAMTMLAHVESELGEDIPTEWLLDHGTVEELAARICAERPPPTRSVVCIQEGIGPPIFYAHGDYLSGGYYSRRLAREIGSDVAFHALVPSGANGLPVANSYNEMAEQHLSAIREIQPRGPYHLGGTCNGGLVVYEVARLLESEGERVASLSLFAASARNVRLRALGGLLTMGASLEQSSTALRRSVFRALRRLDESLARLGWTGLLVTATQRLVGPLRSGVHAIDEVETPLFDTLRLRDHYQRVDAEYLPGAYKGPINLLWPNDEKESAEEAAGWWRKLCPEVRVRRLPSSHGACLTTDVALLAEAVREGWIVGTRERGQKDGFAPASGDTVRP